MEKNVCRSAVLKSKQSNEYVRGSISRDFAQFDILHVQPLVRRTTAIANPLLQARLFPMKCDDR